MFVNGVRLTTVQYASASKLTSDKKANAFVLMVLLAAPTNIYFKYKPDVRTSFKIWEDEFCGSTVSW